MAKKKDNIKGLTIGELNKSLASLREEFRVIRFKGEGAKSKNVKEAHNIKKQIARVLTEISRNNINTKQ